MTRQWTERIVRERLREADCEIGGSRPWDIVVRNPRLYRRIVLGGLPALGDAYVDEWWDCDAVDQFFDRALRADLPRHFRCHPGTVRRMLLERLINMQTRRRARKNSESHYNRGNDLFLAMLDTRMVYSCGYWADARSLDEAQTAKLELICRKLQLEPGMRVLDIGCGWGGFAQYAAERYGCEIVAINLSSDQIREARKRCEGLSVDVRMQDYREVRESFDRVTSIGMLEHVGPRNYRTFMRVIERCLRKDGLCLLHFFATQRSWPNCRDSEAIWIQQHIFPGLVVPSLKQIGRAFDGLFVVEDLQNFGADYDPTLMAWFDNFDHAWPQLRTVYGDRFYRVWKYYLLSCAGAFRSRKYQLWQIVLTPCGVRGGWIRPEQRSARPQQEAVADGIA